MNATANHLSNPRGRDPFAIAKERYVLDVVRHAQGEAATKVAIALALSIASRKEFEASGALLAWPSMRTISEATGIFRSRIERGVKALEASGHLTVERPEKRGATHHNRYILQIPYGRTDAANPDDAIGRTTVANSADEIGRADAANREQGIGRTAGANIGRTDADAMAAPVGPNLTENPPDGAGASTPPAPDTPEDGAVCDVEAQDQDANAATSAGAVERARLTSGVSSLADRAREAQTLIPVTAVDCGDDPAALHFKDGVDVSLDEFDRLHAQAREALARQDAARALGDALELLDNEADELAPEVLNGLVQSDAEARAAIAAAVVDAVDGAAEGREGRWKMVVRAVRRVITTEYSGERGIACADAAEAVLREATRPIFRERDAARKAAKVKAEVVEESQNV
ncbi:hypothetical protein H9N28_07145 [Rhodobacter capsulatus]|uniref:hypothetical protein n=1 Tax=Rhodobacter capsulatus TaxID=1061 RepID=UPI000A54C4DA|nr:hypothetical protein [Rhodobacter capsulatus]PZX27519.1 hypothetical protein LY44_00895 [Rhodobacter capsulatus]QNR64590.1 hypothetical protein H9N28_07145 [Rhodobacter capsulatus]